uniref:Uncharacterized protein n=1 Tax=Falco tinnunculus TaxID=100819 RepID=A0A8C4UGU9_FALTI
MFYKQPPVGLYCGERHSKNVSSTANFIFPIRQWALCLVIFVCCHSELMAQPGKQSSSHDSQSCDPFISFIGTKPTKKPIAILSPFV